MAIAADSSGFPFPVRDIVAVGDRDVSAYAVMLARQLTDNVAIGGGRSLALRWLLSPISDHLVRAAPVADMTDVSSSLLFLTGSRNHTVLGGFAVEPSVDTIRIAARGLGLRDVGLSYSRPDIGARFVCETRALDGAIAAIRRDAARNGRYARGEAFDRFIAAAARETGLPGAVLRVWMGRQLRLLSAARGWFAALFRDNPPEALFCHGGLNFLTAGSKLAADAAGIPVLEIQHGAINMLDPHRAGTPLKPFADELLLAWLPHGKGAHEVVVGPPGHRLHSWLADGSTAADALPRAFRDAYAQAAAEVDRAARQASRPIVLAALQQTAGEEDRLRAAIGSDATVWMRGHPRPSRTPAVVGFDPTSLPLGPLLDHADWVVTGHSSVSVEAAAFGCGVRFLSGDGPLLFPGIQSGGPALTAFPAPDTSRHPHTAVLDVDWMADLRRAGWRLPAPRSDG